MRSIQKIYQLLGEDGIFHIFYLVYISSIILIYYIRIIIIRFTCILICNIIKHHTFNHISIKKVKVNFCEYCFANCSKLQIIDDEFVRFVQIIDDEFVRFVQIIMFWVCHFWCEWGNDKQKAQNKWKRRRKWWDTIWRVLILCIA